MEVAWRAVPWALWAFWGPQEREEGERGGGLRYRCPPPDTQAVPRSVRPKTTDEHRVRVGE
ncbi:hypothetical protein OG800_48105 [Streptomyces sp. NBC_00445]|uniref:hypothetical protein n=1 Tax=Streptomyces sp. NBC_00445 TaxID=2975745 RepID=UPI002E227F9F